MSILSDVKDYLSISPDDNTFDKELIVIINSILLDLSQISSVGPSRPTMDDIATATWNNYFDDLDSFVKEYVRVKAKLTFDPPSSSFILESMNKRITELEFRISEEDRMLKS